MNSNSFISSQNEVDNFLQDLRKILKIDGYRLDILLRKRREDSLDPYTTENTLLDLDYNTKDVRNELMSLTVREYIENVNDNIHDQKPPFWIFSKKIQNRNVYIKVKIRSIQKKSIFCVSFHYARYPLKDRPYVQDL